MININLLPESQRKQKAVDPLKASAALVPLLVLGVIGFLHLQSWSQANTLREENAVLSRERAVLQPFIEEQAALQTEQQELSEVQGVANTLRQGRILWSRQLYAMLATRPTPGESVASRMAFTTLGMRALSESDRSNLSASDTYEGLDAVAEMTVSGIAGSSEVVADYIREIQDAPNFAVVLSDINKDADTDFYSFNMTIGAGSLERQDALDEANAQTAPEQERSEP